jgi:mercuric ion binding protein
VQNMFCAACPYTVKSSLQSVPGVKAVSVSYGDKTASCDGRRRKGECGRT